MAHIVRVRWKIEDLDGAIQRVRWKIKERKSNMENGGPRLNTVKSKTGKQGR